MRHIFVSNAFKNVLKRTAIGASAGIATGFLGSASGLKESGAKEGAVIGAVVANATAIPGLVGKSIVAFRRIRGRIVPLRIKG
jgi:hypothetical protein